MKPLISMKLPVCAECKKQLEPRFTTEKEDGDYTIPEVIMMYGVCDDCNVVTMSEMIQTKDLNGFEDLLCED